MIDLRSDTLTQPTDEMRDRIRDATVGDDKRDGDPTVVQLEERVADLLDMDAAVFLPSGTMGNHVAVRTHTEPGEEIIVDRYAHIYGSEYAGLGQLGGLQVRPIDASPDGCPTPKEIKNTFEERSQWPGFGLLALENTHNQRGGRVIPPSAIDAAAKAACDLGMAVHLDGARLANAAVALDCSLNDFTGYVDSVMFDLSKGLGAPVGAVLAADTETIDQARNYRSVFGGSMRQAGIIAAGGLAALDNIDRLETDHESAATFASQLDAKTELHVPAPDTNLVKVGTKSAGLTASQFVDLCSSNGVRTSSVGTDAVRFCFHLDVDREDVHTAVDAIHTALEDRA